MENKVVFHIDVNSAFLSWTAAYRVRHLGEALDLRDVPSVIAGDKSSRHSIILAKSIPAKKYGVRTGEPLGMALEKCPGLVIAEPDYELYVNASRSLMALLREYSPLVEQFSIDEAWMDMTGTAGLFGPPVLAAEQLKDRIRRELGFTVNIGISCNKLLAKMAGDFEKPDKVHTLFPDEIPQKLWGLPVGELFMVGRATERKLRGMGLATIGQLAQTDPVFLRRKLGKQGEMLWQYANGRGMMQVRAQAEANKGYGNSFTTPCDVTDRRAAQQVLLSLCETVAMRLRRQGLYCSGVQVTIKDSSFCSISRQKRLESPTRLMKDIQRAAMELTRSAWRAPTPIRMLTVTALHITESAESFEQLDLLGAGRAVSDARQEKLESAVRAIRDKFGDGSITFGSGEPPGAKGN